MFFKSSRGVSLQSLLDQTRKLKQQVESGEVLLPTFDEEEDETLNEIVSNLNYIFEEKQKKEDVISNHLRIMTDSVQVGFWSMEMTNGDFNHPENNFKIGNKMRRMLGFINETELPNLTSTLAKIIYPEHIEKITQSIADHLDGKNNDAPFDTTHLILFKTGNIAGFVRLGRQNVTRTVCLLV